MVQKVSIQAYSRDAEVFVLTGQQQVDETQFLVSQPAAIEGGGFRGMRKAVAPSEESEAEIRVGGKKK